MPEKYLVNACRQYLTMLQNQGKLYYIRNNSGGMPLSYKTKAGRLKTRFVRFGQRGSSDFIVFFNNNNAVFIEAKSDTGKLSESQEEFKVTIRALGYAFHMVKDMAEVEQIVKNYI